VFVATRAECPIRACADSAPYRQLGRAAPTSVITLPPAVPSLAQGKDKRRDNEEERDGNQKAQHAEPVDEDEADDDSSDRGDESVLL